MKEKEETKAPQDELTGTWPARLLDATLQALGAQPAVGPQIP